MPHEPPMLIKSGSRDRLVERLKLSIPLNKVSTVPQKAFSIDFKQPMSDYIAFKVSQVWAKLQSRQEKSQKHNYVTSTSGQIEHKLGRPRKYSEQESFDTWNNKGKKCQAIL